MTVTEKMAAWVAETPDIRAEGPIAMARDAVPDTVPEGSWTTVFYRGIPQIPGSGLCVDPINECLSFQKQLAWTIDAREKHWVDLRTILLQQYDLVYVPNTPVDSVNIWVDKYLRRMLPWPQFYL